MLTVDHFHLSINQWIAINDNIDLHCFIDSLICSDKVMSFFTHVALKLLLSLLPVLVRTPFKKRFLISMGLILVKSRLHKN